MVFRLSDYRTMGLLDLGFSLHLRSHSFYSMDPLNLFEGLDHFVEVV
jgi:hypothetical protein